MEKYIQIDFSSFEDKLNEYIATLEKAKSIAEDLADELYLLSTNLGFNPGFAIIILWLAYVPQQKCWQIWEMIRDLPILCLF